MVHLLRLSIARYLAQPLRLLLSVTSIAAGSALIVAVLAIYGSITRSVDRITELAEDADLQIVGATDSGFSQDLVGPLERAVGARNVLPIVRGALQLGDERVMVLGFDEHVLGFGHEIGRQARRQLADVRGGDGLLVGPALGLSAGDVVDTYSPAHGDDRVRVLGELGGPLAELNAGHVAVGRLGLLQDLAGQDGRLHAVLVRASDEVGPGELRRRLVDLVGDQAIVTSPSADAEQANRATAPVRQAMLLAATMALLVAMFVVFNTVSMTAHERRHELAVLRALGGRRRFLMSGFLAETILFGLLGGAIGSVAGLRVAAALVDRLPSFVLAQVGVRVSFLPSGSAAAIGVLVGVVASVAASAVPLWRVVSVDPVESMRPEGTQEAPAEVPRRSFFAASGVALCLAALLSSGLGSRGAAVTALMLLLVGGLFVSLALAPLITSSAALIAGRLGASGQLAATAVQHAPRRAWATTVAVIASVAIVVAISGGLSNTTRSVRELLAPLEDTDLYVETSPGGDVLSATRLPDDWFTGLSNIAGVESVAAGVFHYTTYEGDRIVVEGDHGPSNSPALRFASPQARRRVLRGDAAIISTQLAQRHHIDAGDDLRLATPTGQRTLPVADVVDSMLSPDGMVVLSIPVLREWFVTEGVSWYEVNLEADARTSEVAAAIRRFAGDTSFPLFVQTGEQHVGEAESAVQQVTATFAAMQLVIVGAAAIAVFNTLLTSTYQRRRELGILRAIGSSRGRLWRSVVAEAAATTAVGALVGVPIGLLLHYTMVSNIAQSTGFPINYSFTTLPLIVAAGGAILIAGAGASLPAWRTAQLNVLEAIGYE